MKSISPNLMVYNVNDTIEYYKQYFNFELIKTVPEDKNFQWAMMRNGNVTIMFQSCDSLKNELPHFEDFEPGGTFTLFIIGENIKKLYNNLKDDIEIVSDLKETFYDMIEFTFRDLNGYLITLAEPLK
ncbi:MAG: VOC family protein [Melioribacteraceae bacterium]|nr:VOC family protein [Melioribacteraceae bacterium]